MLLSDNIFTFYCLTVALFLNKSVVNEEFYPFGAFLVGLQNIT